MFRSARVNAPPPAIDLATVRDTILYMQDDIERTPGLEKIATALRMAVAEIDRLNPDADEPALAKAVRFIPWRRA